MDAIVQNVINQAAGGNVALLLNEADALERRGLLTHAAALVEAAAGVCATPDILLKLVVLCSKAGDFPRALQNARRRYIFIKLKFGPAHEAALAAAGTIATLHFQAGEFEKAYQGHANVVHHLENSGASARALCEARLALAASTRRMGAHAEALALFQQVARDDERLRSRARMGAGLAWHALGQPQRAIAEYRAAWRLKNPPALAGQLQHNLALALHDLGLKLAARSLGRLAFATLQGAFGVGHPVVRVAYRRWF